MDHRHSGAMNTALPATTGPSMPPMRRGSMVARPWRGFWPGLGDALRQQPSSLPGHAAAPWQQAARRRRLALLGLILLAAGSATWLTMAALPRQESAWLHYLQTGLFALLFAWVAAGCMTAVMGFVALLRGDRFMLSKEQAWKGPLDPAARTAIIMPICNEDVATVFAGLRATCESLAGSPDAGMFDVYLLSDTSDPALRSAELAAWAELRQTLGNTRIHYRWRQRRTRRKAGNVADFCRRWGRNYRYMVVLDADSVMTGDCLSTLLRLMEANPRAGILQTSPQTSGLDTLHARTQQFATRVTGRLFTMGMQYWQLGEAHYWGHNAIIRVAPFMQHCALAELPGRGGLSGHILSHDFVEAALMRRAGFEVWLVPDLAGSYEQLPPHLLAELQRDRRWCQGNLQNLRLLAEPGLHGVHRAMLLTGGLAYLSAPLWLVYIGLGVLGFAMGQGPAFTTAGLMLLWGLTLSLLFLPRVLGVLAILLKGEQRFYGGSGRLAVSALLEALVSTATAPLRMVAHSLFVFVALTGWKLEWVSPPREAHSVPWRVALRHFAVSGIVVALTAAVLAVTAPAMLPWLLPVGLPLLLAVPLTVWASRDDLGQRVRKAGLLLTPEESWTPAVLRRAGEHVRASQPKPGWQDVLQDPRLCALVSSAMGNRRTSQGLRGRQRRLWVQELAQSGNVPGAAASMRFLSEPNSLQQLRAALLFVHPPAIPPATASSQAYG